MNEEILYAKDCNCRKDFYMKKRQYLNEGFIIKEETKHKIVFVKHDAKHDDKHDEKCMIDKKSSFYQMITYVKTLQSNTGFLVIPIKNYEIQKEIATLEESKQDENIFIVKLL